MLQDVIATILARVLVVLFGVVTSILTARYLGPAGRGEYYLVLTALNLIVGFGIIGLPGTFMYLVARTPGDIPKLHATAFWVALAMGLLGSVVAHVLTILSGNTALPFLTLLWLYVLAPLAIYSQLCGALLTGAGRVALASWLNVVQGVITVGAMAVAAGLSTDVRGFLGATTIGNLGAAIAAMLGTAALATLAFRPDMSALRQGKDFAGRSFVVALCGLLVLRINVLALAHYADASEVGYYSIAAQLNDALIILPAAVSAVLFPRLMKMEAGRWDATLHSFSIFGGIYLLVCVAAAACAPLLPSVFGASFSPAVAVFYWLLPCTFFYGMTSIVSQYLAALGLPRSLLAIWAAATILVAAGSTWLIPTGGAVGAAQALSLACAVLFVSVLALASLRVARRHDARNPNK